MKRIGLPHQRVKEFIGHIMSMGEVYAPIERGKSHSFEHITSPESVVLDYPTTILPPKKFFQPPREALLNFSREANTATEVKEAVADKKILLGIHNYDMRGIAALDYMMGRGNKDESWNTRRQGWSFIGVSYTPDESHFSPSVGIQASDREGLDLYLLKTESGYIIEILTPKGENLVKGFSSPETAATPSQEIRFTNKILANWQELPSKFSKAYENPTWEKNAKKCFSCGSCNIVCPTCYCFDVNDELSLSLADGQRKRNWDSCMLLPFTEVAGGEVFRHHVKARVLHRVFRKFKYITDYYGKPFCVGCGRCIRACTAGISISEMVNDVARGHGE